MSETPATTAVATASAVAPKLNAIQLVEREIGNFIKQREQAIANVHAVEGAIQAAQHMLAILKAEAEKAEAEAKKLVGVVEGEVKKLEGEAATEVSKVIDFVKAEAKKL